MALTCITTNEEQTGLLAALLANHCHIGDCLLLRGDLGVGKTAFARGFIGALLESPVEILSPTFTLVQTYPVRNHGMVWHFDLYRLRAQEEIEEIGLDEALQTAITLIEWPELAYDVLSSDVLDVSISTGKTSNERIIVFSGTPAIWQDRLNLLKDF